MFAAGKSKDMPKIFATLKTNKAPSMALWVTSTIIQLIVISTYWSSDAFALMLNLTSVTTLIPDLFVAIVLPGRMFKQAFADRGLAPVVLSRSIGEPAIPTSPLLPWNSCGA